MDTVRDHQGARGTSQVGRRGGSVGEDGLKRLNSLQQEVDGLSEQPPPPAAPADYEQN